jgi:hypothetical protein
VRIFGANGDLRDFIARSAEDRRAAAALVDQIAGTIEGPAKPIEEAAIMLPHYRIGVSHLALSYVTTPWARMSETSLIYFPSERGTSFLVIAFARGDAVLEQRWIATSPDVAALLQRHLQGLPPIGMEPPPRGTASEPWNLALGATLLAGLSLILLPDHRRWRREWRERRKKGIQTGAPEVVGGLVGELLEAGHVVLRYRVGAISVRQRGSPRVSGIDRSGRATGIEHGPGRARRVTRGSDRHLARLAGLTRAAGGGSKSSAGSGEHQQTRNGHSEGELT